MYENSVNRVFKGYKYGKNQIPTKVSFSGHALEAGTAEGGSADSGKQQDQFFLLCVVRLSEAGQSHTETRLTHVCSLLLALYP